ncbi:MAG: hypothetical protein LBD51_05675 [Bifidobacteriaceae bacterium]|jgi:hypothetical protein|nr:hypothetical protein [Bifidobacteriaceae bacterium]
MPPASPPAVWSLRRFRPADAVGSGRARRGAWARGYEAAVGLAVVLACAGGVLFEARARLAASRAALGLGQTAAAAAPDGLGAVAAAAVWLGLAAWAGFAAGGWRGPVLGDPFAVFATLEAAAPGARAARRRFGRSAAFLAAAAVALWAAGGLVGGAAPTWAGALAGFGFALAGAGLAAVAWLAGEAAPRAARGAAAAAVWGGLAGAWALAAAGPGRLLEAWAVFGLGAAGAGAETAWFLGACAAAALICLAWAAPALARRLWPPVVLGQALAWEAAGLAAASGAAGEALAAYRAAPRRPWGRPLGRRGGWFWAFARADFVALARTPGRLAAGAAGLALAGLALAQAIAAAPANPLPPGALGAAAAVIAYAALGPFTDGLRDWANDLRGPGAFGAPPARLALARLVAPATLGLALTGAGALAGALAGGPASAGWLAAGVVAWTLVALAARGRDALRGAPPLRLAAPLATPMGDPAPVILAAWNADAVLLGAGFGYLAAGAPRPGGLIAWTAAALVLAVLTAAHRARAHLR